MSHRKIIAYSLSPVYERDTEIDGIAFTTAALMTCMFSGETIETMGGGGQYLSPEVVRKLDCRVWGNQEPKAIVEHQQIITLVKFGLMSSDGAVKNTAEAMLKDIGYVWRKSADGSITVEPN